MKSKDYGREKCHFELGQTSVRVTTSNRSKVLDQVADESNITIVDGSIIMQ